MSKNYKPIKTNKMKKTKMPSNWAINFVPCDEVKEKLYLEGRGNYRQIINDALKLFYAI